MSSFNWISTTLAIIALCSLANCILNQKFAPPTPRNEPELPITEEEQSRIAAEINALQTSGGDSEDDPNAWELSGLVEGDILMEPEERNLLLSNTTLWPNATVPYYIEEDEFTDKEKLTLLMAIKEYHNRTCIKFRPYRQNDTNWVVFRSNSSGCWSSVGRRQFGQTVNLQSPGCIKHGIVIHELLHAIGAFHQQSASNRDNYVRILWDNIKKGTQHNFKKYDETVVTDHGVEYDYGSVMHYSKKAFSKNNQLTIEPLQANVTIGQRKGLSEKDITKLERMYGSQCVHQGEESAEFLEQLNAVQSALGSNSTIPTGTNVTTPSATTLNVTTPSGVTPDTTTPSVTTPSATTKTS